MSMAPARGATTSPMLRDFLNPVIGATYEVRTSYGCQFFTITDRNTVKDADGLDLTIQSPRCFRMYLIES